MGSSNKQIIILAGPSASGKSHLIKSILENQDQTQKRIFIEALNLQRKVKIGKLNIERLCNKKKMRRRSKKMMKDVYIVHFDLTSRNQRKRREQLEAIAAECESLVVVTLELAFTTWQKRMSNRVKNKFFRLPLSQALWIYIVSLINKRYANTFFESVYKEWDTFLDSIMIFNRMHFKSESGKFYLKSTNQDTKALKNIKTTP